MAKKAIFILLIITILSTSEAIKSSKASDFIKTSCSSTTYPEICVSTLAIFSPQIHRDHSQLALTSLLVSLSHARSSHRFVTRFQKFRTLTRREREAVEDCCEELDDAVDRLDQAVRELKTIRSSNGGDFLWHISNLQTWVSAALTDQNTCTDGFAGKGMDGKVKASIGARSKNLIAVTSNALALCNLYAQKMLQN